MGKIVWNKGERKKQEVNKKEAGRQKNDDLKAQD